MKKHAVGLVARTITLGLLSLPLAGWTGSNFVVLNPGAPGGARAAIQKALDALPASGGTVMLKAGRYELDGMIHIRRSNVTLEGGGGVVLTLGDGVMQPNLLIGSDAQVPDRNKKIRHITVRNLEFDGNKDKQNSEFHPTKPWLRNNTIDIRGVDDLRIVDVDCHNARSGGVVASWSCERIMIRGSSFHHNFFDGIALYSSRDIMVTDFFCYANDSAGLSLDNALRNVTFSNGHIYENHDVGIFARDCRELSFLNLQIYDNKLHAAFLAHRVYDKGHPKADELVPGTGMIDNAFVGCSFRGNVGYGIFFGSIPEESYGNTVQGCVFQGNRDGAFHKVDLKMLQQEGNVILKPRPDEADKNKHSKGN